MSSYKQGWHLLLRGSNAYWGSAMGIKSWQGYLAVKLVGGMHLHMHLLLAVLSFNTTEDTLKKQLLLPLFFIA